MIELFYLHIYRRKHNQGEGAEPPRPFKLQSMNFRIFLCTYVIYILLVSLALNDTTNTYSVPVSLSLGFDSAPA